MSDSNILATIGLVNDIMIEIINYCWRLQYH